MGLWQGDYQGMGWRDGEPVSMMTQSIVSSAALPPTRVTVLCLQNGPLFPLGFGLSFGTPDAGALSFVSGGNMTASLSSPSFSIEIAVAVLPGAVAGGAVVQLYFSQAFAQAARPKLMLLAFAKVERPAARQVSMRAPTFQPKGVAGAALTAGHRWRSRSRSPTSATTTRSPGRCPSTPAPTRSASGRSRPPSPPRWSWFSRELPRLTRCKI